MEDASSALTPKLVNSLYVEAMLLADEARAYFDKHGREDRMALDPLDRVGFSCESLKVTTRLMHIIAWLLTQRAVEAGELSREQADRPERQIGEPVMSDPEVLEKLPDSARALIQTSCDLYDRVRRLADDGAEGNQAAPSPARSLLSRLQRSI